MLTPFICGSFHDQDQEDQDIDQWSLPSTPKRSSKCCKSKEPRNPYSDRGLDKFTALLADLDKKRQKIYTQKGSKDISLVRFVYTKPDHCKPIIVKVRGNNNKQEKIDGDVTKDNVNMPKSPLKEVGQEHNFECNKKTTSTQKLTSSFEWNMMKLVNWRKPSFYLPVFVIFILLFLAIFGRSFTILCTSIGWYLLPTANNGGASTNLNTKKPRKKEYLKISSHVKVASSEGNISSLKTNSATSGSNNCSPHQHGHKKSW